MTLELSPAKSPVRDALGVGVIALGTVAVNIGVDIVLPAVPTLPDVLGGTTATAQFVLAGYMAGAALGLLILGWLGDHFDRRIIFAASIALFAALSFAGAMAGDIYALIAIRVLQGAAASGPGVVMAGMVRDLYDEMHSVRVIGFLGSVQSLVPAIAPIGGAWLVLSYSWSATFLATGIIAVAVFLLIAARPQLLPAGRSGTGPARSTYRELFGNAQYLRHALGYALVLGGLVIFVFASPVVIVKTMGGTIVDFVVLQVVGIATFIVSANVSGTLAARFGSEKIILLGTLLALLSSVGFLVYALAGGTAPAWLIPIWIPMNIGMGFRGPTSYVAAINAAGTNDARASAMIGLTLTVLWAVGTAAVAPFLDYGLTAVAIAMILIITPAVALHLALPERKP